MAGFLGRLREESFAVVACGGGLWKLRRPTPEDLARHGVASMQVVPAIDDDDTAAIVERIAKAHRVRAEIEGIDEDELSDEEKEALRERGQAALRGAAEAARALMSSIGPGQAEAGAREQSAILAGAVVAVADVGAEGEELVWTPLELILDGEPVEGQYHVRDLPPSVRRELYGAVQELMEIKGVGRGLRSFR